MRTLVQLVYQSSVFGAVGPCPVCGEDAQLSGEHTGYLVKKSKIWLRCHRRLSQWALLLSLWSLLQNEWTNCRWNGPPVLAPADDQPHHTGLDFKCPLSMSIEVHCTVVNSQLMFI